MDHRASSMTSDSSFNTYAGWCFLKDIFLHVIGVGYNVITTNAQALQRNIILIHIYFHNGSPTLQWRHNGQDGVLNHQTHDCLLNRLFRRRSKKTSKLRVTGLCAANIPVTGEFPAQVASN